MIILFPKRRGVKIATTLIFDAMDKGAGFRYILGMIDLARSIGAITQAEEKALMQYLEERG